MFSCPLIYQCTEYWLQNSIKVYQKIKKKRELNGELCVQFLILGELSTKCFIRVIREEFCSLWNAQFETREKKKKRRARRFSHTPRAEGGAN